ncbi:MAG: hypothetical protein Q9225_001357 [Loekoesia sp. 1 TL-2023]
MSPFFSSITSLLALSALSSLLSTASAQQSASILIVNADPQPLVGSVVGTNKATTTYRIQCSAGTDSDDCGVSSPITYIKEGSSSIQYAFGLEEGVTATVGCSLGGTTTAVCTGSGLGAGTGDEGTATGTAAMETQVMTITLGPDEIHFTQIPITGARAMASQPTGAASTATLTTPSNKQSATTSSATVSGGSATGQATPSPSGNTGGATSLGSRSIVALVFAAAMATVMT